MPICQIHKMNLRKIVEQCVARSAGNSITGMQILKYPAVSIIVIEIMMNNNSCHISLTNTLLTTAEVNANLTAKMNKIKEIMPIMRIKVNRLFLISHHSRTSKME